MKTTQKTLLGILFTGAILIQSCNADLRTSLIKKGGITPKSINKGKELLEKSWKTQGLDKLKDHKVYSYKGDDTWRGMLGTMGKVWPNKKIKSEFKYLIGTFDGQVSFLDGKASGTKAGLQNWNYYEINNQSDTVFKKPNKRIRFGISAYQYFNEMSDRLKKVPVISYAGEEQLRGNSYDLVFCTWNTEKPQKEVDQYIVWINKKTGLIDFTQYTIRDNYLKMPGYKMMYGSVEYSNYKNIDGILIAHEQTVYIFKPKKKQKKNLHLLTITDFKFDDFNPNDLIIDKTLEKGGDFK
jgi:hypothetical protein